MIAGRSVSRAQYDAAIRTWSQRGRTHVILAPWRATNWSNCASRRPGSRTRWTSSARKPAARRVTRGLGTLVGLFTSARSIGGTIKLANLTHRVGELLQVTKLVTVFEVFDGEEKAVRSFPKRGAVA